MASLTDSTTEECTTETPANLTPTAQIPTEESPPTAPTPSEVHQDDTDSKAKKGKGGAPKGNKNALTTGGSYLRNSLSSGSRTLPVNCSYIAKQIGNFRQLLEAAAIEQRGKLDIYAVASIQTATEWYSHGLKSRKWLKDSHDSLSHGQRLEFSREIAKAFENRDRILRNLGLDATSQPDVIDVLYSRVPTEDELEAQEESA